LAARFMSSEGPDQRTDVRQYTIVHGRGRNRRRSMNRERII